MAGVKGMKRGRKMHTRHQDDVRAKIQSTQLMKRLQSHVDGDIELSTTQVAAARILLDKAVSNAPQENILSGTLEIIRKVYS